MGERSDIEWTDATWNPVLGCDKVSPGCDHCYAETIAERFRGGPGYPNGFEVTLKPHRLEEPLRWRTPRRVFVNSMSDLFHPKVPDDYVAHCFAVMAAGRRHVFQVLTKRPARMRSLLRSSAFWLSVQDSWYRLPLQDRVAAGPGKVGPGHPLPNVWLGVSVEDQERTEQRIPPLLATPAAVRFLSCEPLLGPVDLRLEDCWLPDDHYTAAERIGWVIVGGESGPGARPLHPQWVRDLRDQARAARVAFFFKQWGAWRPLRNQEYPPPGPTCTLHVTGAQRDPIMVRHGGHNSDPGGWSADLRIREYPDREPVGNEKR